LPETGDVSQTRRFATFAEFCPFSLSEHTNRTCRRLHFTHPFFSFVGRWTMWGDVLARRIKF